MELKTYLRGLGLGLIVAALVTGAGSRQTMSDEQIKARAKELGMTENSIYLTQVNESEEETTESEESAPETAEIQTQEDGAESQEGAMENEETVETSESQESQPQQETESMVSEEEFVTFQVHSGDSSVSVAQRLAELGLVGDAKAFDQYLCQNGYDKKIRVGTYEIRHDSSNEDIAKVITGK